MDLNDIRESLQEAQPPEGLSDHVRALWWAGKGDWTAAHDIIQDIPDKDASWIHAYLHRQEGDIANADYWYFKAGKKRPSGTIEEEWNEIVHALTL